MNSISIAAKPDSLAQLRQGPAQEYKGEGPRWIRLAPPDVEPHETFVTCVAFHPADPQIAVLGSRPQGLYLTRNGGQSWKHLHHSPKTTEDVGTNFRSLLFSRHRGYRLYIGYERSGLFWSDDLLETKLNSFGSELDHSNIVAITEHPQNPNTLYVGTDNGLYRTLDGGLNWTKLDGGLPQRARPSCTEVLFDRTDSETLYTTFLDSAPNRPAGMYVSRDGGESWNSSNRGLKTGLKSLGPGGSKMQHESAMGLALGDPHRMFMATTLQGLQRSNDRGGTWSACHDPAQALAGTVNFVAVHPDQSNIVFAGTGWGAVYRSDDHGETWRLFSNGLRFGHEESSQALETRFKGKDGKETVITVRPRVAYNSIYSLTVSPNDRQLWAATGAGVYAVPITPLADE